jgi:hypothetical protein
VVPLVRYGFFDPDQIDFRLFRWSRHRFVLDQIRDRFARFRQSLVNGRCVSLSGPLERHRQQGPARQVHGMLGSVRHLRAAILHLGDPGVGIVRVPPGLRGEGKKTR